MTTTSATIVTATTRVQYHTTVREMPSDERPRERLERYGAGTLQTAELLAIILRVGVPGENVIELSNRLLNKYSGLGGLVGVDFTVLCGEHGLGQAKAAQLKAALELGRRLTLAGPEQRPQITNPRDVVNLLSLGMGYLAQEQLRVLCLRTPPAKAAVTRLCGPAVQSGVKAIEPMLPPRPTTPCAA